MSWQATAHVLKLAERHRDLTPMHLLVLYTIAGRYSRDHRCAFGQVKQLCCDSHMGHSKLMEVIGDLEDAELITVWIGKLPRRRDGSPSDGRMDRGLMYCFSEMDPDGPDVEGAERRKRLGGRPDTKSVPQRGTDLVPPDGTDLGDSVPPDAEISSIFSSAIPTPLNNRLLKPAVQPEAAREAAEPDTHTRAREEASPQRAIEDGQPVALRGDAQVCPICSKPFIGPYAEHKCPINRRPHRTLPPKLGNRISLDELRRVEAELAELARARAEQRAQEQPELQPSEAPT